MRDKNGCHVWCDSDRASFVGIRLTSCSTPTTTPTSFSSPFTTALYSFLLARLYWRGNLTAYLSCLIFPLALYLGSANLQYMLETPPSLHPGCKHFTLSGFA